VIIIAIMGEEAGLAAAEREEWLRFASINAVRNNWVHTIDSDLICSPSPQTFVEALETIAPLVHPELVIAGEK